MLKNLDADYVKCEESRISYEPYKLQPIHGDTFLNTQLIITQSIKKWSGHRRVTISINNIENKSKYPYQ